MMLALAVFLALCVNVRLTHSRVFERCELARELQRLELPDKQIATWVCIARHESEYNSSARNYESGDHGLFQISELWWCGEGTGSDGACGVSCAALRDDNLEDDVACARRIYREHTRLSGDGFNAWVVYPTHCRGDTSRYVDNCKNAKNLIVNYDATSTEKYTTTTQLRTMALNYKTLNYKKVTTTQKSTTNVLNLKNIIYSTDIHKLPHKVIDHPTGDRYKYNINKSGFALFKEN